LIVEILQGPRGAQRQRRHLPLAHGHCGHRDAQQTRELKGQSTWGRSLAKNPWEKPTEIKINQPGKNDLDMLSTLYYDYYVVTCGVLWILYGLHLISTFSHG
jgi:hypothetical protein